MAATCGGVTRGEGARSVHGSSPVSFVSRPHSPTLSAPDCGGLENVVGLIGPSRVRIPPPPLRVAKSLQSGDFASVLRPLKLLSTGGRSDGSTRESRGAGTPDDRAPIARGRLVRARCSRRGTPAAELGYGRGLQPNTRRRPMRRIKPESTVSVARFRPVQNP